MSIRDLIADKVRRGMLHVFHPKAAGSSAKRALLVHEEVWGVLESLEGDQEWERRVANLRADLDVFADGSPIDPKYLFLLYPASEAVWEIRSVRSNPSIRVLGIFAEKDVFVATNYALREKLGGWQSREWKDVKRMARTKWGHLFHTYPPPLVTTDIHKLVTGALDGRYLKDSPNP